MTSDSHIQHVDPARLASGWCPRQEKTLREGDITASYSGDRIGMNQPVRKPFTFQGGLWVCTGKTWLRGEVSAEAYRLVALTAFEGQPTTYREKTLGGDAARDDPNGFHHGMTVQHGGGAFVLAGPPVTLAAGVQEQMDLFDSAPPAA